jgi:hypothetical protein
LELKLLVFLFFNLNVASVSLFGTAICKKELFSFYKESFLDGYLLLKMVGAL